MPLLFDRFPARRSPSTGTMRSLQSINGRPAARCDAARLSAAIRPRLGLVARAAAGNDAANAADAPSTSRRSTILRASSLLLLSSATPGTARAASSTTTKDPINRYVKRKRLDPLASYVPALLLAREQLIASAAFFAEGDATSARALLRSGAFRGVRESVRAVGEYATEAGQPGGDLVASFLRELEAFDARMRVAEREQEKKGDDDDTENTENNNKGAEEAAVAALDALVATVPSETVERARQVVASAVEGAGGAAPAAAAPAPVGRGGGSADPALIEGLLATE